MDSLKMFHTQRNTQVCKMCTHNRDGVLYDHCHLTGMLTCNVNKDGDCLEFDGASLWTIGAAEFARDITVYNVHIIEGFKKLYREGVSNAENQECDEELE